MRLHLYQYLYLPPIVKYFMETFTKKIQDDTRISVTIALQYAADPQKPRRSHCCAPVHLLYFYIVFFRFVFYRIKERFIMSVMELLTTRRTYRRFVPKGRAAGWVDDIVQAVRLSSLRGKPAGGAFGAGAKPGDGGQGTAAGQMGWLSAAGAGHAWRTSCPPFLCSCGAGYRHSRRPLPPTPALRWLT